MTGTRNVIRDLQHESYPCHIDFVLRERCCALKQGIRMLARPFKTNATMSGRLHTGNGTRRTRARLGILIALSTVAGLLILSTPTQIAQAVGFSASINFQRTNDSVPSGFLRDFGQGFGVRTDANQGTGLSYGWIVPGTQTPVSIIGTGRDRGFSAPNAANLPQELDTFIHAQSNTADANPLSVGITFNDPPATVPPNPPRINVASDWQIAVPAGTYDVTISVGDPNGRSDGGDAEEHQVIVETVPLFTAPFSQAPAGASNVDRGKLLQHQSNTLTGVAVTDGFLTLAFPPQPAADNTKINYIRIVEQVAPPATATPTNFAAVAGTTPLTAELSWDPVVDATSYNVFRNGVDIADVAAPTTTFTDTVTSTGAYSYSVTAVGPTDESDPTAAVGVIQTNAKCANISPFDCGDVRVALPFALDFDASAGGLVDLAGVGTGFTMVDAPSARMTDDGPPTDPGIPGYEPGPAPGGNDPAQIEVTGGALRLSSSKGIMFRTNSTSTNTNSQLNTLGVGVDASQTIEIRTTISADDFASSAGSSSQQGGLWFGLDEDNFAKLVLAKTNSTTGLKVQLQVEAAGGAIGAPAAAPLQIDTAGFTGPITEPIELVLRVDPATNTVTGSYQIGAGAIVDVTDTTNTSLTIPAAFTAAPAANTTGTFAGVFVTHRSALAAESYTMAFDSLAIDDVQPPATPTNLIVAAGNETADVSWNAVSDATEYIVSVDGTPRPATTNTSLTLTGLSNGTTYAITVTAVDASGNTSTPTPPQNVTPDVGDVTPPSVPSNVDATPDTGAGSVTITWNPVGDSDLAGYRVYRGTTLLTPDVPAGTETFTDTGRSLGDYSYSVASFDAIGNESARSSAIPVRLTNAVCGEVSPLECGDVRVALPFALDFDASAGGLVDLAGVGTGFTLVDAPSARLTDDGPPTDPGIPGYEPGPAPGGNDPAQIEVTGGELRLSSSKGIMFKTNSTSTNTNSQLNTLGVGVDASEAIELRTTITDDDLDSSAGSGSQQGGLWFGLDEDNFAKLVLAKTSSTTGLRVQLQAEADGGAVGGGNNGNPYEINMPFTGPITDPIELVMRVDPATNTVTGSYQIGAGPIVDVADTTNTSLIIPASLTNAPTSNDDPGTFAGVFVTHRNAAAAESLTMAFDSFAIDDVQPPATPTNLIVAAGDETADVSWTAVTDATEYIVSVDGTPRPATTNTSLTLTGLTNGTTYAITVTAVDASGNESDPTPPELVTPTGGTIVPCLPVSTLTCGQVVSALPFELTFDGTEGGLVDPAGDDLGFTMVDTHSQARVAGDPAISNADIRGYEPSLLDVAAGSLTIDARKGIQYLANNALINALGTGVDLDGRIVSISTTINPVTWPTTPQSQQTGLWYGLDEDNLFKLVIANASDDNLQVQLLREVGGTTDPTLTSNGLDATVIPKTAKVRLWMVIDDVADTVSAYYSLNGGPRVKLDKNGVDSITLPSAFGAGKLLSDGTTTASFAGVFATNRNGTNTPGIDPVFDDFAVREVVPELTASPDSVALSAEIDDSISTEVAVEETLGAATNVTVTDDAPWLTVTPNALTPGTLAVLADATGLAVGQYTATISISAIGYTTIEVPVTFDVTPIPPPVDLKINFQANTVMVSGSPVPVPVPAGYLKDVGQPYGPRTDADQGTGLFYGWILQDDSSPLDLTTNGRDRNRASIDQRLDTFIHMQYGDIVPQGTSGNLQPGRWEIAVPDGLYEVDVSVGDQPGGGGIYDSVHAINVEGAVALETFQGTTADEYESATATVGVSDGRLSIDAVGGTNTKINYVHITEVPDAPHVTTMRPLNRSIGFDPTDGVSADISVPGAGVGVDANSLDGNVKLFDVLTGLEVPSTVGTSGGNDNISLQPDEELTPGRQYRFVVTSAVTADDAAAAPFVPFVSLFTAGEPVGPPTTGTFEPLTGVSFDRVEQLAASGDIIASMAFGPDGKLYTTSIGSGIHRFDVAADGTLSNRTKVGPAELDGRAIIGIVFDTSLPSGELGIWITHATANIGNESQEWGSKVSHLSGANLETIRDIFVNLPRSKKDHLSNSIGYGPNGDLYFLQGSNQAAGDPDGAWGDRGETLLTAAMLHFSPTHPLVLAAKAGGAPIDVRTDAIGGYDPFDADAPLKLYATGIRNAYDFVFHSNGHLYVPTNGTAGGGNSPGVNVTPESGAPTTAQRLGQDPGDYTAACLTRRVDGLPYTAGDVPAITNHSVQEDHLYDVEKDKYYGHPNPERCEWVLHSGNPTAGQDPFERAGGSNYPVGVQPDPNYAGYAYNFGYNKSPNGTVEYTSNTFGGQLKGRILVVRFSNNNDIVFLQPDDATGAILGAQLQEGIDGVANSTIGGVGNFKDPLEIIEDPSTGNLYVNQYDQGGSGQGLFLLRVPAGQEAPGLDASEDELVFSATVSAQRPNDDRTIEVTNDSDEAITLSATIAAATSNSAVSDYSIVNGDGVTLAAGATTTVTVRFDPTQAGNRNAVLRLGNGDDVVDVGLFGIAATAYEGGNEPTLSNVLVALGHGTDVGWNGLAGGVAPTSRGAETYAPLFEKAGAGSVMMTPLAQYAPQELLPFGWYTGDGSAANRTVIGTFSTAGYQKVLPPLDSGGTTFDPGSATFGLFYQSNFFGRIGYTEDAKNGSDIRRARIYPAKNRAGTTIANAYIIAFEDADNGDYQDYVFLVRNVKPAGSGPVDPPTGDDTIKVNFQSAAAAVPAGYLRDFGEPYGTRTLANQGTGLSYGWLDQTTKEPIDLSVGGTGPGNGRDRNLAADQRYDTLINLQSADQAGTVNGTSARALWEIEVPNGDYEVTIAVGDPGVFTDPEFHSANVEGTPAITRFAPTGIAGATTRHTTQTVQVEVTDGRLTIDAIGGQNSKFNFVEITPINTGAVQVNFQPAGAVTPAGWVADTGAAFSTTRGYGWLVGATPTDRSSATRLRTLPAGDPLRQTFNIIQNDVVTTLTNGTWEYALPNGEYAVEVSVGDSDFTNSLHSVSVEGVNIISQFLPSTGNLFQTAGGIVTVNDNRLTLTAGFNGSNTKVNWIKITETGNDENPPTVDFDVQGVPAGGGAFANRATVGITATDFGSGVEFLTYRVNSGPVENYVGPISLQAVGEYVIEATAVDNAGNSTTESVSVSVEFREESQAEISLINRSISRRNGAPIPGFYDDWLVMSRLNSGTNSIPDFTHKSTDSATLTIQNTGVVDDLTITALTISNPDFAIIDPPTLPLTLAPGASSDVVVRLVDTTGSNGTRQGTLTIVSDDADEPNTVVQLRGLWQVAPEGGNEPLFRNIIAAFGWTTSTGTGTLSSDIGAPASGEEVISARWERADTTKPLVVRQLVAYHGCPGQALIQVASAQFRHGFDYCQSALPLDVNGNLTEASASPTSKFTVYIGGLSSVGSNGLLGVRFFPVRDREGDLVANSWIVIQDYVQSGCGTGAANCDFNDNMLLITNIKPADSSTDPGGGGGGGGEVSVPGSATTPSITVTPADQRLTAIWDHPTATKFQFRYKTASSASGWKWDTATTQKTRTVTGLTNGTAYDIQVRILIGGIWQDWNTATATPGTSGPPANKAPVVNAGPDQTVIEGSTVTLAATATDDGLPTPPGAISTSWSQFAGNGLAQFDNNTSPTSTVTFPSTGTYVLQWTADDTAAISTDQVSITVLPASTPVPAPTVNPATGTYSGSVAVTMSSSTPNSQIRYTTDGTDPTPSSTPYVGALTLSTTTTVKARVYPTLGTESAVTTRVYTIQASPPGGGEVSVPGSATTPSITVTPADQRLTATWDHPSATKFQFRYKTASSASGWKWDAATTQKTRTVTGLTNGTAYDIQVRILLGGIWQDWNTATATPGTSGPPATPAPSVSPASGNFSLLQSVTMSTSVAGGVIRYTLDGNDPGPTSDVYGSAILLTATTTVKARVFPLTGDPSAVTTRTYTLSTGGGGGVVSVPGSATLPSIDVTPGNRSLSVAWNHPKAVKYQLRYKLGSSASGWVWDPTTTDTSRTLTGLTNGVAYDVQVRVLYGGTWKPWNTATATPTT